MVKGNKWLAVPTAILLGSLGLSLYGVLHPLPPSTEPPRIQAATSAAACYGLLSLLWIQDASSAAKVLVLSAALLGMLGFSMYRIYVHKAACPSDTDSTYIMAGGGKFQDLVFWSVVVLLVVVCMMRYASEDEGDMRTFLMYWLGAVGIGLACAAGGRYRCSETFIARERAERADEIQLAARPGSGDAAYTTPCRRS